MSKYNFSKLHATVTFLLLIGLSLLLNAPAYAQTQNQNRLESLRSDVGIHGLTANFHWLNDMTYMGNDTLQYDGSSELELVYRNVRMMTPHLGVGYQLLTSFFVNGTSDGGPAFGVGSWGLGPVIRAYPFSTERFQPYVQAKALMGNNMAIGRLANTADASEGFRVRLGLRAGVAYRINNNLGFFVEFGPDWGSGRIFRADSRAYQLNVGIDLYRFN